METEQIIICLFFIVFFFILFLFVRYIPIKIVKMRAKKYDMKLNTTDVKELIKMRCVKNSFFKLISVFVREGLEYDVVQLAFHYVSGGNLDNVFKGFLYAKKNNVSISYPEIYAIDLANRNIVETIKKGKPYLS